MRLTISLPREHTYTDSAVESLRDLIGDMMPIKAGGQVLGEGKIVGVTTLAGFPALEVETDVELGPELLDDKLLGLSINKGSRK